MLLASQPTHINNFCSEFVCVSLVGNGCSRSATLFVVVYSLSVSPELGYARSPASMADEEQEQVAIEEPVMGDDTISPTDATVAEAAEEDPQPAAAPAAAPAEEEPMATADGGEAAAAGGEEEAAAYEDEAFDDDEFEADDDTAAQPPAAAPAPAAANAADEKNDDDDGDLVAYRGVPSHDDLSAFREADVSEAPEAAAAL